MIQFRLRLSTAHLSRFLLPALILLNVGCSDDARKNEFEVKQPSADEARAALIAPWFEMIMISTYCDYAAAKTCLNR